MTPVPLSFLKPAFTRYLGIRSNRYNSLFHFSIIYSFQVSLALPFILFHYYIINFQNCYIFVIINDIRRNAHDLTQKIIKEHLIKGTLEPGSPIEIKMDQTLTQDATGTMAYMQLEAMGIKRVKTEISVSYVDHNTLQNGYMNADDHAYLQSVAAKYGVYFSRPGNGICHQVHLERFAKPSKTLIGSDSHTPTSGAMGCLAIGAGGLDVAKAMAGIGYRLTMPKVVQVNLHGKLSHGVSSKDIILELLKRLSVKGGVSKVFEYTGEGVKGLSVYQRATITNMGAELGATTSIFPSDEITLAFLKQQNREEDYIELKADEDATYDEYIDIDLSSLRPMAACQILQTRLKTSAN